MSISANAYSIVGVFFDRSKLYSSTKKKTFSHEHPEDMNFCPQTGRELWKISYSSISEFDDNKYMLGNYKIIFDYTNELAYCALFYNEAKMDSSGCSEIVSIPNNFQKELNEMKEYLETLGLWTDTFGLHAVLNISC